MHDFLAHIPAELHTRDVVGVLNGMDGDCSTMPILLDAIRDAGGTEDHVLAMGRALIYGVKGADAPRLWYADWLGEAGEAERSALIRCQVELARTPTARIVDDQICRKCNRRCGDRPSSKYCEHGSDPDGKNNHQWENPLRRRERELLDSNELLWIPAELTEIVGGWIAAAALGGRNRPEQPWKWQRGFISSVTLDWSSWLRHHAGLFWSSRQRVECDNCEGAGEFTCENSDPPHGPCPDCGGRLWSGPYLHPDDHGWDKGTGRKGPRPFVASCQPLETVRLTTLDGQEPLDFAVVYFSMEDEAGKVYRFDRVKCGVCKGVPDVSPNRDMWCPDCRGRPLNLWECEEWPGVKFVMPE